REIVRKNGDELSEDCVDARRGSGIFAGSGNGGAAPDRGGPGAGFAGEGLAGKLDAFFAGYVAFGWDGGAFAGESGADDDAVFRGFRIHAREPVGGDSRSAVHGFSGAGIDYAEHDQFGLHELVVFTVFGEDPRFNGRFAGDAAFVGAIDVRVHRGVGFAGDVDRRDYLGGGGGDGGEHDA